MAEERVQRRLAAILAADVVGYSRLMGEDETGTLAALNIHRAEFIHPTAAEYGGRIVKLMGDGALVEFPSVVDAVECAVAVQQGMAERNINIPDSKRITLRIGINLGDIIIDGDDIYGDGVNVAARLEGEADPGGICISGDAYRQVTGKIDHAYEDLGELTLKNIAEPVRAYRVTVDGVPNTPSTATLSLPEKPSIAVLPFDNMSGDPEQEYFSDGITEDIITALSQIRQFFVIARNTTFTYKGRAVDVQAVAKELGVRYVLEGSIRQAGGRIRITAQLIDGETGNHIWAERYDRDLEDIFAVQDEITTTVIGAIQPELSRAEQARARRKSSENLDAWDLYQRGVWHSFRGGRDDLAEAQLLLQRAIELDSEFCLAHAHLAFTIWRTVPFLFADAPKALDKALAAAKRAIAIDNSDAHAHWAIGVVYMQRREHELAQEELERAIELNPSFAFAYQFLGWTMVHDKQPEEGIRMVQEAQRLSPNDPFAWGMILIQAQAYLNMREFAKAERLGWQAKRLTDNLPINCVLLASMGHTGSTEDRKTVLRDLLNVAPEFTAQGVAEVFPFRHQEDIDIWVEGLRLAGVPEK